MRILICHNYYAQRSGECNVVQREMELLRERGHEVEQFTYDNASIQNLPLARRMRIALNAIDSPRTARDLQNLLRANRFDVAHVHNTWALMSPSVYRTLWRHDIPVVKTVHNYRWLCPAATLYRDGHVCHDCLTSRAGPLQAVVHRCYQGSYGGSAIAAGRLVVHKDLLHTMRQYIDVIVVQTEFVKRLLADNGYPEDRMVMKGNFVQRPKFIGTIAGEGYFVFWGRLEPTKGLGTLLSAVELYPARLRIFGKGPLSAWVRSEVSRRFGETGRVTYEGYVPDDVLTQAVASATAVVFPSEWYESYPLTIVEAMSLGKPVIASRLGSIPFLVRDRVNGLLFEPRDPASLSEQMARLEKDSSLRASLQRGAHEIYDHEMSPDRNYELLKDIYARAIAVHHERHS